MTRYVNVDWLRGVLTETANFAERNPEMIHGHKYFIAALRSVNELLDRLPEEQVKEEEDEDDTE